MAALRSPQGRLTLFLVNREAAARETRFRWEGLDRETVFYRYTLTEDKLKEPDFKKYPFKSAVVEYTFSGDASGKMMQYIDHYGVREATEDKSTVKFMGQEQKNNTMTIFDQDSLFMIERSTLCGSTTTLTASHTLLGCRAPSTGP